MILEGDHVLRNKRGVAKGGRGKKDKRKKGSRAVRGNIIPVLKEWDFKPDHKREGVLYV